MPIPDPFLQGIDNGWQVQNASLLENDLQLEVDVVIVAAVPVARPAPNC